MASATCPKCAAEVPVGNLDLHELRCTGAPPPAAAAASARAADVASLTGPTPDDLAEALTWARTRPLEVAEALRERLQQYKGLDYYPPGRGGRCVVTKEGAGAVREAIAYVADVEKMAGVGVASERGLALAAEDHVADIGITGTASHASSDGAHSADRARRYGSFEAFGECLWYGSEFADARTIVLDLIVDDGVASRGHRKGVYNPAYDVVGTAYGSHATFSRMAAMEFARGWQENTMFVRARLQAGPRKLTEKELASAKAAASTQWKLRTCPMCQEPIKGGRVVEIAQLGKLHLECFKCGGCSTPLSGAGYKLHAGTPFCTGCYYERYGERCVACSKAISGGMVKCALGQYHVECVICSSCNVSIGKNSFSTAGGVISCQSCAAAAGPRSAAAGSPAPTRGSTPRLSGSRLATTGSAIAGAAAGAAARPKAGVAAKAKAKTRAAPKKVSCTAAKANVMALGMDYASLE